MKENNIKTSWTFPIIEYSSQVYYFEVKKASGIVYILLELISNVENHSERIVSTLYNLGVPYDIHYIFGDELFNMINNDIIHLKDNRTFYSELLSEYVVSDFELTDLGRKLFADGTIPTGREEMKKATMYFDVVAKDQIQKFKERIYNVESTPLDLKCFGEVFLGKSDIELFISDNMKQYGFRNNESISKFAHEEPVYHVYKSENAVNISFDEDKMFLVSNDKVKNEYLKKYYSANVISGIIMNKSKFNFPKKFTEYINQFEYDEVRNKFSVFMPSQIQNVLDTKCEMALSIDATMKKSNCIVDKKFVQQAFQTLGMDYCYACYFVDGNLYTIMLGNYSIALDGWNEKCSIQLIVVAESSSDEMYKLLNCIYNEYIPNCNLNDKCSVIKSIYRITNNQKYLESFMNSSLSVLEKTEDKVNEFLSIHDLLKSLSAWNEIAMENATMLLNKVCSEISVDNIALKHSYGKKLKDMLNMYDSDYLTLIGNNLKEKNDDIIVFEALSSLGYAIDDVLNVSNALKVWINDALNDEPIYNNTELGVLCSKFQRAFNDLKSISGVDDPINDEANIDINNDEYIKAYNTFKKTLDRILKYKMYVMDCFESINSYSERFTEISDMISLEKEANANPRKIDKKYIKTLLNKSKYKEAICDLHVRLEYELNSLLNIENNGVFELLEDNNLKEYLTNEEITQIHNLRICRNGFLHPEKRRNIDYSTDIIMEWYEIVEKIGGYCE